MGAVIYSALSFLGAFFGTLLIVELVRMYNNKGYRKNKVKAWRDFINKVFKGGV